MNCAIEDCERQTVGRGWCRNHYMRWRRTGDPLGSQRKPIAARLFEQTKRTKGCWEWTGETNNRGYGVMSVGQRSAAEKRVKTPVHVIAYREFVGAIPDGLEIDHLCKNRVCIRFDHLEAVTHAENVRRSMRDTCPQGHAWTAENIYWWNGSRHCRACRADVSARRVR